MALNVAFDRELLLNNPQYSSFKATVPIKDTVKDDFVVQITRVKAVSQNPEAGTLVASGSKVIVYFENVDQMGMDIFEGVHSGYAGKIAKEVVDVAMADEAVKKIIDSKELSVELTPEEEVTMHNFFVEKLGLEIDESDPAKSEKAAYDVLAASYALMK
ncbi:MAG: hypothetical protein AB7E77_09005 [Desulfobulbus sp.]